MRTGWDFVVCMLCPWPISFSPFYGLVGDRVRYCPKHNSHARPRASDLGLKVGVLPAGPLDAITDVAGVEVGQTTIIRGDNIRTGVTAVRPILATCIARKCRGRFSWAMVSGSWRAPRR